MRYTKHKLVLFFTVQTIAVTAMIALYQLRGEPTCALGDECAVPPAASMLLAISMILGELTVLAAVLRSDPPVWHALLGLGLISLVTAFLFAIAGDGSDPNHDVTIVLAIWHVVVGLILLVAGTAAAFWRLLQKLRRPDTPLPDDLQSSAIWPLD